MPVTSVTVKDPNQAVNQPESVDAITRYNNSLTAPAPAPVAPAPMAPEPTIGETLTGIKNKALTIQEQLNAMKTPTVTNPTYDKYPTYEELYPEINEKEIARRQRRLFQSEIDATNRVYDDILSEERLAGQGRLGTGRAIAARGGLLGSDFGEAQRSNIVGANQQATRAIQNERMAKIGTIMGTMRKAVADELTEKRNARQQGAQNYIDYLASAQTRKENNRNLAARAILDSGMDITTMDPAEIEAIGKEAGLSAQEIIMAYNDMKSSQDAAAAKTGLETRKTEAEINKINADIESGKVITLGEGTMLYNTETGETFKNPKTYAPKDPSGIRIGAGILNQEAVSDIHATLNETRGQPYKDANGNLVYPPPEDRYANTQIYMDEFNGFVALGGDPKDFIKEFDPNIYINPNDPTRSFLQASMKKTPEEIELTEAEKLQDSINALNALRSGN